MIAIADVCIYRADGYSGPAVFFPLAAVLLAFGIPDRSTRPATLILAVMLIVTSARLAMNGSNALLAVGTWLLVALPYCLRQWPPFLFETLAYVARFIPLGHECFRAVSREPGHQNCRPVDHVRRHKFAGIAMPVASAILFSFIFLMANPEWVRRMSGYLGDFFQQLQRWLNNFTLLEFAFWGAIAWLTAGALRPIATYVSERQDSEVSASESPIAMYDAFQRTLMTVILLFVGYLVFEFHTLTSNVYERGFGFSDYAHEGAMWLTVALVMATLLLSLIFRRSTFADPRIGRLKRLAWIWIALNLVLAVAVYTRLSLYIGYNGMSRMRVVGLLGVTAVVGGFALMRFKIARQNNFYWLVQRQLWILGIAVFLFVTLPVDLLCHRYNVARILAGDPAPSVQIAVHPVDSEAYPQLIPLLSCADTDIRQGVKAMLRIRRNQLARRQSANWSASQWSDDSALRRLEAVLANDEPVVNSSESEHARFRAYTMQWY